MRSALVANAPAEVQVRLETLVQAEIASQEQATARVDAAVRSALVLGAPVQVRQRLAALTSAAQGERSWLAAAWRSLRERPGVLAGQLAAVAVLAYVVLQLFAWLGTLPVVVGDVPYALELLVFSPAVDYLGQVEGLVQQLALWLMVGAAGFILVRGFSPRPHPEP